MASLDFLSNKREFTIEELRIALMVIDHFSECCRPVGTMSVVRLENMLKLMATDEPVSDAGAAAYWRALTGENRYVVPATRT